MALLRALKLEALVVGLLVVVGGFAGWAMNRAAADDHLDYEVIASDGLEPFLSAFNANSDHIKLVLLVGPT